MCKLEPKIVPVPIGRQIQSQVAKVTPNIATVGGWNCDLSPLAFVSPERENETCGFTIKTHLFTLLVHILLFFKMCIYHVILSSITHPSPSFLVSSLPSSPSPFTSQSIRLAAEAHTTLRCPPCHSPNPHYTCGTGQITNNRSIVSE